MDGIKVCATADALNSRMGEVMPVLEEETRQAFAAHFARFPAVQLHELRCTVQPAGRRIGLRIRLVVDYGKTRATAVFQREIPFAPTLQAVPDILDHFRQNAGPMMKGIVQSLPHRCTRKGKHGGSSRFFQKVEVRKARRDCGGVPFPAHAKELANRLRPEFEEEVREKIRLDLEGKQRLVPEPAPWVRPGRPGACRVNPGVSDAGVLTLRCEAEVEYCWPTVETISLTGENVTDLVSTLPLEELDRTLEEAWWNLAHSAVEKICSVLVPYQVVPPEEAWNEEPFPPDLWSFLCKRGLETEHCRIRSGLRSTGTYVRDSSSEEGERGSFFLAQTGPDRFEAVKLPLLKMKRDGPVALGVADFLSPADPLSGAIRPVTLGGTLRVLRAIAEEYEKADYGELEKPPLRLWMKDCRLGEIRCGNGIREMTAEDLAHLEERPRAFADTLVEGARQYAWNLAHEDETARQILGSLNPTVLALLQTVCRKGSCRDPDLERDPGRSLATLPASLRTYEDLACQVTVPVCGIPQRLIKRIEREPAGPGCALLPISRKLREILLEAVPAPYALEDYPNLRPSERPRALAARAATARTREERWATLEILERGIPEAAAADFVKSETGQAFLLGLEGDDRQYARLSLEDLPGCKRLVGSLLGP